MYLHTKHRNRRPQKGLHCSRLETVRHQPRPSLVYLQRPSKNNPEFLRAGQGCRPNSFESNPRCKMWRHTALSRGLRTMPVQVPPHRTGYCTRVRLQHGPQLFFWNPVLRESTSLVSRRPPSAQPVLQTELCSVHA